MYSEHLVNLDLILLALISTLACFHSSLLPICQDSKNLLPLWPQYIFFTNVTISRKHIFYQYVQSVLPLWPFCSNWPLWLFTNVSLLNFYQNVPSPPFVLSRPAAQEKKDEKCHSNLPLSARLFPGGERAAAAKDRKYTFPFVCEPLALSVTWFDLFWIPL